MSVPVYTYFPVFTRLGYIIPNEGAATIYKISKNAIHNYRLGFLQQFIGTDEKRIRNFIESTAFYCVLTYILQIGDRHNDNIMVTPEGELLRIVQIFKYF